MLRHLRRAFWIILIGSVILYGIFLRVQMYESRRGFSGEDTFSLLNTARAMTHFEYPPSEKRLPLYPLLLTPVANNPLFAIEYGKILSVLFGSFTLILVAFITYHFTKNYLASFVATTLVTFNVSLIVVSSRALTDALFIFLNTFCLFYAYLYINKRIDTKSSVLLGLLLGLNAMTRFEGFITAFIILGCYFFFLKAFRNYVFIAGVIFVLCVSPWFIKNTVQYGNPLSSPYLQDKEYGISDSDNFKEKLSTGVSMVPTLFFKYDKASLAEVQSVVFDSSPLRWKVHLLNTQQFPKASIMILGLSTIFFMGIGLWYLYKKNFVYAVPYSVTTVALYLLAMFIWLRLIARFYNSQLPLMAILIGIGISVLVGKLNGKWKYVCIALLLYATYNLYFVQQKEISDRFKSEYMDTYDNYMYLETLKYTHSTRKNIVTNIPDRSILPFYIKNSEYIERFENAPICSFCLYLVDSDVKKNEISIRDTKAVLLKSFYQPTKKRYLLLYKSVQ